MRLWLLILGVFAAILCVEKLAYAQNGAWCAYYDFKGGATNCGFANISTMLSHRERHWRVVWTQSAVPAFAGTISVD
jgi:hypothetical protein